MYRLLLPLVLVSCHALSLPSDRAGVLEVDDFDLISLVQAVGGPVVRRGQRRTGPTAAAPAEDLTDCDDFEEDGAALMQSSLRQKSATARQEEIEDEESDESVLIQTSISQPVGPAVRRGQRRTGPTAATPAEEFADCDDFEEDGAALMQSSMLQKSAATRLAESEIEETDESVLLQTSISQGVGLDEISLVQSVGSPVVRRGQRRTGPTAAEEEYDDCEDLEEDGAVLMQSSLQQRSARTRLEEMELEETDETVLVQTSVRVSSVLRGGRQPPTPSPTPFADGRPDCDGSMCQTDGAVPMRSSSAPRAVGSSGEEERLETDGAVLLQTSVSMSRERRRVGWPRDDAAE